MIRGPISMDGCVGASPCIWPTVPARRPANGYRYVGTSGLEVRSVSMYINVCIDTYTQAYTKADTQAYIRIYIHAYAWGYTLIHAHAYIQGYVHMYTCVYTRVGRGGFMRWYVGSHPCGHPGVHMGPPRSAGAYPGAYGHIYAWMGPSGRGRIHRCVLARKYRRTGISRWENG